MNLHYCFQIEKIQIFFVMLSSIHAAEILGSWSVLVHGNATYSVSLLI